MRKQNLQQHVHQEGVLPESERAGDRGRAPGLHRRRDRAEPPGNFEMTNYNTF